MQVLSTSVNNGYKQKQLAKRLNNNAHDVSFNGMIRVKSGYKVPLIDPGIKLLGLITALTSTIGFGLGGAGLNYDYYHQKRHGIKGDKQQNSPNNNLKNSISIEEFLNSVDKNKQKSLPAFSSDKKAKKESEGEGETGVIDPKTKFGKFGMKAAKIGIFFSGVAGVFNGIAMKVPLMSVGEGLNIAASPIVNTPTGFGLFNIALATVFAGRALENNPALKLNSEVLASKVGKDKIKYVGQNMKNCLKEVWTSTSEVGKQFGNLFKSDANIKSGAKTFFRDCIIDPKSSTLKFSEKLYANGKTAIETGMKSYPYRMHFASVILAAGGGMLLLTGLLKKLGVLKGKELEKSTKAGFKVAEAGGALDNIGLSYSGIEKIHGGSKGAGIALAASGLGILSGTPKAERADGRGRQWLGTSLLFAAFAIERFIELKHALKANKKFKPGNAVEESAQLIREWEIHLPDAFSKKFSKTNFKDIVSLSDSKKYNEIINKMLSSTNKDEVDFAKFVKAAKSFFAEHNNGLYKANGPKNEVLDAFRAYLKKAGIDDKICNEIKILSQGKVSEISKSVIAKNVRISGKNYIDNLKEIINNKSIVKAIRDEASEALEKLIKTVS